MANSSHNFTIRWTILRGLTAKTLRETVRGPEAINN